MSYGLSGLVVPHEAPGIVRVGRLGPNACRAGQLAHDRSTKGETDACGEGLEVCHESIG